MLKQIAQFQKDAQVLGLNQNNVEDFKLYLYAQEGGSKIKNAAAMSKEKLDEIVKLHRKWLLGEKGGVQADLAGANLNRANLNGANLTGAYRPQKLEGYEINDAGYII